MKGNKVLLTLNPVLHEALKKKADASLMTVQEFITALLRRNVLTPTAKNKGGRPRLSDDPYLDMFSRKR